MNIQVNLRAIESEADLVRKALKLALLVATAFRERGYEMIMVGGSAIEFYTDGDYMSGDIDLCFWNRPRPPMREIAEVMGGLGATGNGVRTFKIAGLFVDVLGTADSLARTEPRRLSSGDGSQSILVAQPEELLPERVLVAVYPSSNAAALACARKLAAACVQNRVAIDWDETMRIAALPAYRVEKELAAILAEVKSAP